MNKIIIAQDVQGLHRAFEPDAPNRAEPGDMIVLTAPVTLKRDLVVGVPVTIALHGEEVAINCGKYGIQTAWKNAGTAGAQVLRVIRIEKREPRK